MSVHLLIASVENIMSLQSVLYPIHLITTKLINVKRVDNDSHKIQNITMSEDTRAMAHKAAFVPTKFLVQLHLLSVGVDFALGSD